MQFAVLANIYSFCLRSRFTWWDLFYCRLFLFLVLFGHPGTYGSRGYGRRGRRWRPANYLQLALINRFVQSIFRLKGNIAMMKNDYDGAVKMNMRKGLDLGMPMKEAEGASLLQMGMLAMQKNDIRKAEGLTRAALSQRFAE